MAEIEKVAGGIVKEREHIANPSQELEQNIQKFVKFGGFEMLETVIDGTQNLNPSKKARKKYFWAKPIKKPSANNSSAVWNCGTKWLPLTAMSAR